MQRGEINVKVYWMYKTWHAQSFYQESTTTFEERGGEGRSEKKERNLDQENESSEKIGTVEGILSTGKKKTRDQRNPAPR